MKTQPANTLERGPDGSYVGNLAQRLSDDHKRAIRKVLAEANAPLYPGQIAARAGVTMTTPSTQQELCDFVGNYLVNETREVERATEPSKYRSGREAFRGFVMSEHGRNLFAKGLS